MHTNKILCQHKQQHKDVNVTFCPEYAKLEVPNGTVLKTETKGKLYYLNSVEETKITNAMKEIKDVSYAANE